jgi:hypothetical protein
MAEPQVLLLMLAAVAVGFFLGRYREEQLMKRMLKLSDDNDLLLSYCISQYKKLIEVCEQNTSNVVRDFVSKTKRDRALKEVEIMFEGFSEEEFVKNIEKKLDTKLAKVIQD